jgi:hypothetical protein
MQWLKAGEALVREWETTEAPKTFLVRLTHDDLEAISRVAVKDGHPMQAKALALLGAIYATD